jgi:periplasmic divalent cation tolerance protein
MDEAKNIGKGLLEKRLAACINIFPISSMYWWKDKIEEALEFALIVKTKYENIKELKDEVKQMHSYETPCICAFAVKDGPRDFFDWIDEVTKP